VVPDFLFSASAQQKSRRLSGNVMLRKTVDLDWSSTDLGPIDSWPDALKSSARLILTASMPLALLVGPSGTLIYNDAIMQIFPASAPMVSENPYLTSSLAPQASTGTS
jgi:hypothetical protein